ncbi:hypothetical protein [Polaromonas sp.]|uniref:hypothetical protein n=1 Tax=Polaromonas sp. TaxID=1869339 RepID=UPI00351EAD0A
MAKEDTTPGLLSKVVKFVRNPATNWSELEGKESDREEALSKQMLKEMIERNGATISCASANSTCSGKCASGRP